MADAAVDAALHAVASSSPGGVDVIARALAVIAESRRAYEEGLVRGLPAHRTPRRPSRSSENTNTTSASAGTNIDACGSASAASAAPAAPAAAAVASQILYNKKNDNDDDDYDGAVYPSTPLNSLRHPPLKDPLPALHRPPSPPLPLPLPPPLSVLSFGASRSASSRPGHGHGSHIPLGYAARIPSLRPQPEAVAAEEAARAAATAAAAAAAAAATSHRAPTPPAERAARAARAAALRVSIDGGLTAALEQLQLSSRGASANANVSRALESLRLPAGYGPVLAPAPAPALVPALSFTSSSHYATAETIAFEDPDVTVARLRRRLAAVDDVYAPTLAPYTAAYAAGAAAVASAAAALPQPHERLRASVVLRAVDAAEAVAAAADAVARDEADARLEAFNASRLFLSPDASLAGDGGQEEQDGCGGGLTSDEESGMMMRDIDVTRSVMGNTTTAILDTSSYSLSSSIQDPLLSLSSTEMLLEKLRGARIAAEAAALALPIWGGGSDSDIVKKQFINNKTP